MGLFSSVVLYSSLFSLITAECVCNFTVDQRQTRQGLCLGNLNATLYQRILSVNQSLSSIRNVSFDLEQFLKNESSSANLTVLDFVAMGGLGSINWTAQIGLDVINNTDTDIYVETNFVTPVQNALQKLAVNYSFPYGIFRQETPQVYYVGLNLTNVSSLCYCKAGGEITLTFISNASLDSNTYSTSFAAVSLSVENDVTSFMAAHDPFRETFIYCRLVKVERPGASPPLLYLGLVFTETTEPDIVAHLDEINTSLPEDIWPQNLAKFGFVSLYNYTPLTTTTPSTTLATTTVAEVIELLSSARKLRVSMSYLWSSFDSDRITTREMHIIAIGVGGFVGLLLGLLFLFVCLQIRLCTFQDKGNGSSKKA